MQFQRFSMNLCYLIMIFHTEMRSKWGKKKGFCVYLVSRLVYVHTYSRQELIKYEIATMNSSIGIVMILLKLQYKYILWVLQIFSL